ncbi:TonB-dependent receptor domain-containing protein [Moraxella boevrei]|uniref:TonB-dependent receptor domain-containing protein n=1 Tax=Faucicola boevrei TaxID=346665 RepID=UPI00373552A1
MKQMMPRLLSLSVVGMMYNVGAVAELEPHATLQTITIISQNTANNNQKDEVEHADNIPAKQAYTLNDYLPQVPGVNVGGVSLADQHIYIRGLGSDRHGTNLKITVDGVRQPETRSFYHGGLIALDPDLYKKTEVSVGNNSVTLGNNAMGGAVAFTTVDAEDLLRLNETMGARLKLGYATNDKQLHTTATAYGKPTGNTDVLLSLGQRKSDGGKDGDGVEIQGDDITVRNVLAKASIIPMDGHKLTASYQGYDNKGIYNFGANKPLKIRNPQEIKYTKPTTSSTDTFKLAYEYQPNDYLKVMADIYKIKEEQNRDGVRRVNTDKATGITTIPHAHYLTDSETIGFNVKANQSLNRLFGKDIEHFLTYGVEGYEKKATNHKTSHLHDAELAMLNAQNPTEKHTKNYLVNQTTTANAKSLGVYAQDRMTFGRFAVTPGVRFDNYNVERANDKKSKDYSQVSFGLAGEYKVLDNTTLFASYTQLFNGPSLPETTMQSDASYPLGKLKPETGSNSEIGFNTRFNQLLANNDRLNITAKYFYTDYQDKIDRVGASQRGNGFDIDGNEIANGAFSQVYKNLEGSTKIKGYELMSNYQMNNLAFNLGYAHAKSKKPNGVQLTTDSGNTLTLGADYYNINPILGEYRIGANIRHVADVERNYPNRILQTPTTKVEGFTVVDLTGSFKPTHFKNLSIDAGIYNVGDKTYVEHTGFTTNDTAMGRNIKISATYQF